MNYKQTFEAYVREKCPELNQPNYSYYVPSTRLKNGQLVDGFWKAVKDEKEIPRDLRKNREFRTHKAFKIIQLHHILRVLNTTEWYVADCVEDGVRIVLSGETDHFYLPLTSPSEWPEDVYQQLCKIVGV